MKLIRMKACFGRLQDETLTLTPGLNLLQLPNEGGKSTWAEFLLAMLYGVDTAEREKAGVLPVKTKYQPWSGEAMSGVLELEHEGRRITITRTSTQRAPMGVFSAVYTDSGLPVEGMTGANCGEQLLGVPKSVFQRSAFVRQQGLGLTPDDALERRLSSLVTTGDERVSYAQTEKRLRDWRNRCQHNKTGRIPETQRALDETDEALAQLQAENEKNRGLHAQKQRLLEEQDACRQTIRTLQAIDAQTRRQQLYDARRAALAAANRENAASALCARLPAQDTLQALRQEAEALLQAQPPEKPPEKPEKPACPAPFTGVDEPQLLDRAQRDMREFDRLTARKYRAWAPFAVLAAVFLALAAAVWFLQKPALYAAIFAALAVLCIPVMLLCSRSNRLRERELDEAQAILRRYQNRSRDEFAVCAAEYGEALRTWQADCARIDAQQVQYDAAQQLLKTRTAALLGSARMFTAAADVRQALDGIRQALQAYDARRAAALAAQQAKDRADALAQALGEIPELPVPDGARPAMDMRQAEDALRRTQAQLAAVQSQLDQCSGRLQSLGAGEELSAQRQTLEERLQSLQERLQALTLAQRTLDEANAALAARFSPRLVQEASALFARLTGGKYARVTVDRQMQLQAAGQDETLRRLLSLSCGTADELYLAVRLAICRLLLPPGAPIVLDDALVMFDDERLSRALQLLQELAQQSQILLFTCHSREARLLQA